MGICCVLFSECMVFSQVFEVLFFFLGKGVSLSLFAPSSSLIWMSVSFMSVFFFNDGDLWLYCM